MSMYRLRDNAIVPLICPTCQNVFKGRSKPPALTRYFAWGCFRYFGLEGTGSAWCLSRSRVARRALVPHPGCSACESRGRLDMLHVVPASEPGPIITAGSDGAK